MGMARAVVSSASDDDGGGSKARCASSQKRASRRAPFDRLRAHVALRQAQGTSSTSSGRISVELDHALLRLDPPPKMRA
jgi:hypothetical protein